MVLSPGGAYSISTSKIKMATPSERSEDILGQKWDRCITDSLIKLGTGFAVGTVFSVVLFKRRTWPILFGSGIGLGVGLGNCQTNINKAFCCKSAKAGHHTPKASQ